MIKSAELSNAIAHIWEQAKIMLGSGVNEFEAELLTLLRYLDNPQNNKKEDVIKSILSHFHKNEDVYKLLIQAIRKISAQSKGVDKPTVLAKMERYTAVTVFYGTNRRIVDAKAGTISFGAERGDLSLGVARVSIPDDHRMGKVERPALWKLQFRETPQKHVMVLSLEPLMRETFIARTQASLGQDLKKEIMLFVHGYNVGFVEALTRASQIAYDLKFEGLPALFSWPSEGSLPKYTVDETNVAWARPDFVQFLHILREEVGAETIHIIAHSMGNRLVTETIASMNQSSSAKCARICQIVLAAPDIDAATFKDLATTFHNKAERFTLYASSDDKALMASKAIHKYPRAGESGPNLVVVAPIDTVDVTSVDTSFIGHAYYGENRSVLTDLFELIRRGSPPQERFGLVPMKKYGARYWLFSPS
jgi:esterase/lipase superfamily enzyme